MIRLRPYKACDKKYLIKWISNDKVEFAKWCANKFNYPIEEAQLERYFQLFENDAEAWLMTALDEKGTPVGHFLMRLANYETESIHLGFIIVDSGIRGKGYGKEMVSLAVKYAFEILKMKRVTLGVFDNHPFAHRCYQSVGFRDETYDEGIFSFENESWGIYNMVAEK